MSVTALRKVLPILTTSLLLLCAVAAADDAAIELSGGVVKAMESHPTVVMEEMRVDVNLTPDSVKVDCHFAFRNTGPATTVRIGFPESGGGPDPVDSPGGFRDFETRVDGALVRTTIEGLQLSKDRSSWRQWRVKQVQFARDQVRQVQVTYSAKTNADVSGHKWFTYEVGSGGSWKEAIGKILVRVYPQYDAFDWMFNPDPRLQAKGDYYEWKTSNFEPKPTDIIGAGFKPADAFLIIGPTGEPPDRPRDLFHRDMRDGHFWVEARRLKHLLGFELYAIEWPNVRLTLGSRRLDFYVGQSSMLVNGASTTLSGPPYIENGKLRLPLAEVARALGAVVDYNQEKRILALTLPIHTALAEADMLGVYEMIANTLSGYTAPDLPQFAPDVLRETDTPWLAVGDFAGDGKKDAALLLHHQGAFLFVTAGSGRANYGVRGLGWYPTGTIRQVAFRLRTVPPGKVSYWESGQKSGQLDLKNDGIELVSDKASVLYYWDEGARAYKSVQTAD